MKFIMVKYYQSYVRIDVQELLNNEDDDELAY